MANDIETTEIVETEEIIVDEAPKAKTRKELKKERKELKKHKKEVKKEARKHSAKATKFNNFLQTVMSILVIASMVFCSYTAIQMSTSMGKTSSSGSASGDASGSASGDASGNNASGSGAGAAEESTAYTGAGTVVAEGDLATKEGVVEYFKTAHAKVLAEAKSVTRTYDNTINYNEVLEIGGNSTLEGIAKSLMGTFMKENTEELVYTGADMKANFPAKNKGAAGLTADMVKDAICAEDGDNYIITIVIDSSEESPDLGDKSSNLVNTVDEKQVTDAAGSMVSLEGLENHYIAPKLVATIDKATGQITAVETTCPSYMCFSKATAALVISVSNCRIGLEYQQKWTVQW